MREIAKPFLKWAGGKTQLLNEIEARIPKEFCESRTISNYIEPFIGGGAVFFYLKSHYDIQNSCIMDINPDLILCYRVVKNDVNLLIDELLKLQLRYSTAIETERKEIFYEIRSLYNIDKPNIKYDDYSESWITRAVQFIFLNKTCFNGLYRENSRGEFNVPQGSYKNPTICETKVLKACSNALKHTVILWEDFDKIKEHICPGTFIYYDPPYRPLNSTSSFNSYSKQSFNDEQQKRLANLFREINKYKTYQMLSNSDPKNIDSNDNFFDELYSGFYIERVNANRFINSIASKRGSITELLITNYDHYCTCNNESMQISMFG